ncbi:MAG: tetratricopeptide repeat protein [Limisphaerales bacterium]
MLIHYLENLAAAVHAQGKLNEAESLYQRALMIAGKNAGFDGSTTVTLLEKYAALLKELKKPVEAKLVLEHSEKIREQNSATSR